MRLRLLGKLQYFLNRQNWDHFVFVIMNWCFIIGFLESWIFNCAMIWINLCVVLWCSWSVDVTRMLHRKIAQLNHSLTINIASWHCTLKKSYNEKTTKIHLQNFKNILLHLASMMVCRMCVNVIVKKSCTRNVIDIFSLLLIITFKFTWQYTCLWSYLTQMCLSFEKAGFLPRA